MNIGLKILFSICFMLNIVSAQTISFTQAPSLSRDGTGKWRADFTVDQYSDVAVSIVNLRNSSVVRHLAAGALGAAAPAPLAANSLRQRLEWDGHDDWGGVVTDTAQLAVRVQAGLNVALEAMVGENHYSFRPKVMGLAIDSIDGSLYVYGAPSNVTPMMTIRKYDSTGVYLKTVFPYPGDLTAEQVRGYGISEWPDGRYSPRMANTVWPLITSTIVGNLSLSATGNKTSIILPKVEGDELVVFSLDNLSLLRIKTNGGLAGGVTSKPLITSPALPAGLVSIGGPRFLCISPDHKYALLSGVYEGHPDGNGSLDSALTTGFWKDGQIFKVDLTTGTATSWLMLDSIPGSLAARSGTIGPQNTLERLGSMAAIHGVAMDDSGHVFVCDRFHQRLAVYDTNAQLLNALPVENPDLVEVNKYNGMIYVVSRSLTANNIGHVSLRKFSGWRPGAVAVDSLIDLVTDLGRAWMFIYANRVCMAVKQSPVRPILWISSFSAAKDPKQRSVWRIADEGDSFRVVDDFARRVPDNFNSSFDRIDADPRNETVYINDDLSGMFKLEDWQNPIFVPCSTSAKSRLAAYDFTIGMNNLLYVRQSGTAAHIGPIRRYSLDHLHAPVPFTNTNTNILVDNIYSRCDFQIFGDKGLSVYADGQVAIMAMSSRNLPYFVAVLGDSTYPSNLAPAMALIDMIPARGGGVRYDYKRNLYVGVGVRPQSHAMPAWYATDQAYDCAVGAVVKFAPGTGGTVTGLGAAGVVTGAERVYATGYAPLSGECSRMATPCVCRSPRFDVDAYGRLYLPNAITNSVTIIDNGGNELVRFGRYGNIDDQWPEITLAYPAGVAATENYIYVSDMVNCRVLRIGMDYKLDNMPDINWDSGVVKKAFGKPLGMLVSSQNPYMPGGAIKVYLPRRSPAVLAVYDLKGSLIKTLFRGEQPGKWAVYRWDAMGMGGKPVANGIYVMQLTTGNRRVSQKAVFLN